MHIETASNAIH